MIFHVFFEISTKCRQIVPTPRGSILKPPRASQVPYKATKTNCRFSIYFPINSRSTAPADCMFGKSPCINSCYKYHCWIATHLTKYVFSLRPEMWYWTGVESAVERSGPYWLGVPKQVFWISWLRFDCLILLNKTVV